MLSTRSNEPAPATRDSTLNGQCGPAARLPAAAECRLDARLIAAAKTTMIQGDCCNFLWSDWTGCCNQNGRNVRLRFRGGCTGADHQQEEKACGTVGVSVEECWMMIQTYQQTGYLSYSYNTTGFTTYQRGTDYITTSASYRTFYTNAGAVGDNLSCSPASSGFTRFQGQPVTTFLNKKTLVLLVLELTSFNCTDKVIPV